ncbi:hypothetical protein DPEC_G00224720 [Dallia pectoralis]|uniref:Uncharacterized protein n=1 Tax=Dallia pectoralis TaxID=75939 RepID=A0ACC2G072_DALPE|nr:hypothetical protein DPEC_G00224720 [Dallia pectoralis]
MFCCQFIWDGQILQILHFTNLFAVCGRSSLWEAQVGTSATELRVPEVSDQEWHSDVLEHFGNLLTPQDPPERHVLVRLNLLTPQDTTERHVLVRHQQYEQRSPVRAGTQLVLKRWRLRREKILGKSCTK